MLQSMRIAAGINDNTSVTSLALQIQAYGKQCAEEALKVAAERARIVLGSANWSDTVDKESILSTPIITP